MSEKPEPDVTPVTHSLKCWPEFFARILDGTKTFEVRRDDRAFRVGHTLRLREWRQDTKEYTGREAFREVTYLLDGPAHGVERDHVAMGLRAPAAAPAGRRKHDGDCTIYAALINGRPEDGICTCGHGRRVWHDSGSLDAMYSDERLRALPAAAVDYEALAEQIERATDETGYYDATTRDERVSRIALILRAAHASRARQPDGEGASA